MLNLILDIIYPPRCPICKVLLKEKELFCKKCLSGFKRLEKPFCSICSIPFSGKGTICESCLRKRPYFDLISAPFIYKESAKEAIHILKYQKKISISRPIGRLFSEYAIRWWRWKKEDFLIVPVPLSKKKLKERGFNQSLILARYISDALGIPMDYTSLRKVKETESQTYLSANQRKKNIKDAFQVMGNLRKRNILLIDDVATTGSTLNECAKALKKAGAEKVICLVFARSVQ